MPIGRRTFLVASAAAIATGCASSGSARVSLSSAARRTVTYGDDPSQVADLYLPSGAGPFPVVVLIHGGFWRAGYDRSLMVDLANDLTGRGIAAWNIEYRRVGARGSAWPALFADVAAATDVLATLDAPIDRARVVSVGHSAGGHLALWLAARHRLAAPAPGSDPVVAMRGAMSQAGIADLVLGERTGIGGDAVDDLLGGPPATYPDRYAIADPAELLPIGVTQVLLHGDADANVPIEQSRTYAAKATALGDHVELVELPGVEHFAHLDPRSSAWAAVTSRLPALLG